MKYTRSGLIKHFYKLPPKSKPCRGKGFLSMCPIAIYLGLKGPCMNIMAREFDERLADAFDKAAFDNKRRVLRWSRLTAEKIVEIAKSV